MRFPEGKGFLEQINHAHAVLRRRQLVFELEPLGDLEAEGTKRWGGFPLRNSRILASVSEDKAVLFFLILGMALSSSGMKPRPYLKAAIRQSPKAEMVRVVGIEPTFLSERVFETRASTSFTTPA